jgi:Tol biopolymer transport system component
LRLIPPLGGPERKLGEIRPQSELWRSVSLAWCPDSNGIVVTDSAGEGKPDALFVVSLESGEKRRLTDPQHPVAGDTDAAVSPDGRWLVFRRNAGPFNGELYRLPLGRGLIATGEPSRLTLAAQDASIPTWMPDNKEILFSAKGSLWRLAVSGARPPARLPFVGEDGVMPVVSRAQSGRPPRLVYVRSYANYNIWRVQTSAPGATASSAPFVAISSTRWEGTPQFSPDGRRVAFASSRSGKFEIWLADPDGSNAVQLTSMGALPGFPRWSPDGELIAFHSNPEGQGEVYLIPAAGGKPRNLTSHPAMDAFPSFSPDGRSIYFSSNRAGGDPVIWKVPLSGGEAVRVTNSSGAKSSVSPDGAYLYYVETAERPSPLWRLPVSGGVAVKVLEEVFQGNFTVLERGIYYIDWPPGEAGSYLTDRPSGNTRLQYFDFATRRSRTVARNLGNLGLGLTASPDGRTILYSRMDSSVNDLMLVENFR